jgi:hypothetical protein
MKSRSAGLVEVFCGELVEGLSPRQQHAIVDRPSDHVLGGENLADCNAGQGIAVG